MCNVNNPYFNDENSNKRLWMIENKLRAWMFPKDLELEDEFWKILEELQDWRLEYFQNIMEE